MRCVCCRGTDEVALMTDGVRELPICRGCIQENWEMRPFIAAAKRFAIETKEGK